MRRLWRNYSLSVTLAGLFIGSWVGQWLFQVLWLGEDFRQFGVSTLENWQSEFMQLMTFVALGALLRHRGSPESKDSEEETQEILAIVRRLEARLRAMQQRP